MAIKKYFYSFTGSCGEFEAYTEDMAWNEAINHALLNGVLRVVEITQESESPREIDLRS